MDIFFWPKTGKAVKRFFVFAKYGQISFLLRNDGGVGCFLGPKKIFYSVYDVGGVGVVPLVALRRFFTAENEKLFRITGSFMKILRQMVQMLMMVL